MSNIRERITPGEWERIYEMNVQSKANGRSICSCGRNSSEPNNHSENMANALVCSKVPAMLDIIE